MCISEKIHVRYASFRHELTVLLAMSSMLMNQQYILNKVSLNKSTNKTRYIDQLTKMYLEFYRNLTLYFL